MFLVKACCRFIRSECRTVRVHIPDVIVSATRGQFDANVISVNLFERFENFKTKTSTILDTTAPLISAFVGCTIKKLGNKITVGTVDYSTMNIILTDKLAYLRSIPSKPAAFELIAARLN
jgi:hypothetical protein